MSDITAITPQVKDKERCNIYVDGKFYCGLKLETALRYRLKAGEPIDLAKLDEIQLENEKSQALDKAMTHLSASMKTEKQIRDYLKKKGYVDAVCDYVLEKLRGCGIMTIECASGKDGKVNLHDLMRRLGQMSVNSILLEGGAALSQLWIFVVAPLVGAALSALVWKAIAAQRQK